MQAKTKTDFVALPPMTPSPRITSRLMAQRRMKFGFASVGGVLLKLELVIGFTVWLRTFTLGLCGLHSAPIGV